MMMGAGYGSLLGWLGMGLGIIMHIAFAVGAVLAVIWLFKAVFTDRIRAGEQPAALELVKARYAKGEISAEDYQRIKQDLE